MNHTLTEPEQALAQTLAMLQQSRLPEALHTVRAAVAAHPLDARLRFLLGSLLAGQGEFAAAEHEMAQTTALDPGMLIAHFQLGSLRMTSGDGPGALAAWQPLATLPDSHPLRCFSRGCTALIADDFAQATHWLQRGLDLPSENTPLNRDMSLLLERIRQAQPAAAEPEVPAAAHLLIHGYQDSQDPRDPAPRSPAPLA
jgi:hypothetical protein